MTKLFTIAVITGGLLNAATATAFELPTYEMMDFPITPHQVAVLGSTATVQEQSSTFMHTFDGMPACPHQLQVLTPRIRGTAALTPTNTSTQ
jgi:hypothetical protein